MTKRILIIGAGANQARVVEKARALGLYTVAVDDHPNAPGLPLADAAEVADIMNPAILVQVARKHAVDAVYAATERAVEAAAHAALELGLPGISPEVAFRVRNKLVLREALRAQGLGGPAFRGVKTIEEAETAARDIGLPVIVKPADASASRGVQRVDYIEDISLAFVQALKSSPSRTVLIESFMEGEEYNVDGHIFDGEYRLGGITGKERSDPPYRYDTGLYMPPALDAPTREAIVEAAATALRAIGFVAGTCCIEIILTADGPRAVEVAAQPYAGCGTADFISRVYGMDYLADSLRIALGDPPEEQPLCERGCALYWIPSRSGVVTKIEGVNEARAMPGVEEVLVSIQPGDVLGHVVDCVTRDRIGCVLASADTAAEAVRIAKDARDTVHVVTRPTFEKT